MIQSVADDKHDHGPVTSAPARPMIGTAGWSLPTAFGALFAGPGSHLHRYARRFAAVEINSSFHRPHRRTTYQRWADSVPAGFRFAVKLPRTISHAPFGPDHPTLVARFAGEVAGLGDRLGPLLVQFPPKLAFHEPDAAALFALLRGALPAAMVCEPRHASWFTDEAGAFLAAAGIARVAADPAVVPAAGAPGGWPGLRYHRLHGAPHIYRSPYEPVTLADLAARIAASVASGVETWCVFDNTAAGAATDNALDLAERVAGLVSSGGV